MDITVDIERGVVLVVPRTSITAAQAGAAIEAIVKHPEFSAGMPSIWDLRGTELMHINAQDVRDLSEQADAVKHLRGNARIAFVVSSDLGYGLGRMFEMLNETSHIDARVFRDYGEAERWALPTGE